MTSLLEAMNGLMALSPWKIFLIVLLLDWGLVNLLMAWPERRFLRPRYITLSIGDSPIGLPLGIAGLQAVRHRTDVRVDEKWFWLALIAALAVPIGMTVLERLQGQYTLEEQLTPSKLAHTIVLGLLIGWIVLYIPSMKGVRIDPVDWSNPWRVWPEQAILLGMGVWIVTFILDSFSGREVPHAHKSRALMRKYGLE